MEPETNGSGVLPKRRLLVTLCHLLPERRNPPMASAGFLARPMMACDRHEVVLLTLVVIGMYTSLAVLFSLI